MKKKTKENKNNKRTNFLGAIHKLLEIVSTDEASIYIKKEINNNILEVFSKIF